jgi:hypothetical protein
MRSRILAVALALAPLRALPAQAAQPAAYTLTEVERAITRKMGQSRLLELLHKRCIDFAPNAESDARLRKAGATLAFLDQLRQVCSPANPRFAEPPKPAAPVDSSITVIVRLAILQPDLSLRFVPQHDLLVLSWLGDTSRVSTGFDGSVELKLKKGDYRLEGVSPIRVQDTLYRFSTRITVQPGMRAVELTQKNAEARAIGQAPAAVAAPTPVVEPPKPVRSADPEKEIVARLRSGVFTVSGIAERGTGFLVDSGGLVLTNAHLIDTTDEVRVQVDPQTKVRARVLTYDASRDIAVLAINMTRCAKCAVLPLADSAKVASLEPGDRVVAMASPLNAGGFLSLGIVNGVDAQAVVSEVNVSPAGSGGPLLNLDGEVVGVNRWRAPERPGAPRSGGSIVVGQARAALTRARAMLATLGAKAPLDTLLPVLPGVPFPADAFSGLLNNRDFDARLYRSGAGGYRIFVMTPQVMAWRAERARTEVNRRRKEGKFAGDETTPIDPIQAWRDWDEYLSLRRPVVVISISPSGTEFPHYDTDRGDIDGADVLDLKLYRQSAEITPVERVRVPSVLNARDLRDARKRVPGQGIFVYRIEDFRPLPSGSPASMSLRIVSTNKKEKSEQITLDGKLMEQILKDFTLYKFGGSSQ